MKKEKRTVCVKIPVNLVIEVETEIEVTTKEDGLESVAEFDIIDSTVKDITVNSDPFEFTSQGLIQWADDYLWTDKANGDIEKQLKKKIY